MSIVQQYIIIFFISMVPLIELRGAIPYAVGFGLPLLPGKLNIYSKLNEGTTVEIILPLIQTIERKD